MENTNSPSRSLILLSSSSSSSSCSSYMKLRTYFGWPPLPPTSDVQALNTGPSLWLILRTYKYNIVNRVLHNRVVAIIKRWTHELARYCHGEPTITSKPVSRLIKMGPKVEGLKVKRLTTELLMTILQLIKLKLLEASNFIQSHKMTKKKRKHSRVLRI